MRKIKNGFTLVELLAVIVVLTVVALIAVPNINSLVKKSKTNMFCKKVESIEAAAKNYGQDNFSNSVSAEESIVVDKIPLRFLVEKGYLNKDKKDCTIGVNCVLDERDNSSLDNNYVQIYAKNNRLYGRFLYSNADISSKVCGDIVYHANTYETFNNVNLTNERYGLDVNSVVNGANVYSNLPVTFDVYINGEKVTTDTDYCVGIGSCGGAHDQNSTYELRNIRVHSGYTCFIDTTEGSSGSGVLTNSKSVIFNCKSK